MEKVEGLDTTSDASTSKAEKVTIIALMCSLSLASNATVSLILPFLPEVLDEYGLDGQILAGFIFAIFPLSIMIFSPLCNWLAKDYGRLILLYIGLPVQIAAALLFGYTPEIMGEHKRGMIAMFLSVRAAEGFGAACANLAIYAIVADNFKYSLGKVMGCNEVLIGFGFMIGPVIGSTVFAYGGMKLCFIIAAASMFLIMPLLLFYHSLVARKMKRHKKYGALYKEASPLSELLLEDKRSVALEEAIVSKQQGSLQDATYWGNVRNILVLPLILTSTTLLVGSGVFGWVETILSMHLHQSLKVKQEYVGFYFAAINITYITAGPFIGILADRRGYNKTLLWGIFMSGTTLILLGPVAQMIGGHLNLVGHDLSFGINQPGVQAYWEMAALGLLGIAQALTLIPSLPAMKGCIPGPHDYVTLNTIVMLFNQFQQAGIVVTTPLSGALATIIGFPLTIGLYGLVCLLCGLIVGVMLRRHSRAQDVQNADGDAREYRNSAVDSIE